MKKWIFGVLLLITILSLSAELGIPLDAEHSHWWNRIPGFFIFFGFLGCLLLIFFAKSLGKYWLTRDEDYYDDK